MACRGRVKGGRGGNGTIRRKKNKDPGSECQKFICNPIVLVPLHGRASSRLVSASFLRPGAGKRVGSIADRRNPPIHVLEARSEDHTRK